MTTTISAPYWVSHDPRHPNRVCDVPHLLNSYDHLSTHTQIDAGIVTLIVLLNEVGLVTRYCCSGLDEDHRAPHFNTGYISFADALPVKLAARLPHLLYLDTPTVIRMVRGATDDEVRGSWAAFEAAVREWAT